MAAILKPELILAAYIASGSEADPATLVEQARSLGCQIALPCVENSDVRLMSFRLHLADGALEAGPHGLSQPPQSAAEVEPDVIMLPLLAFDRRGHRLGQGGGYFDRALARLPHALKVGIAFAMQEVEAVPVEPWDIGLNIIITEREWIVP